MPWEDSVIVNHLHVAVGIVINTKKEILIAKRPAKKHLAGFWEFPGGKVEQEEDVLTALKRELKEEVNIEVIHAEPFMQIPFTYPEKKVLLDIWQVKQFSGTAEAIEQQEIKWVSVDSLSKYSFPEANQKIINKLFHCVRNDVG